MPTYSTLKALLTELRQIRGFDADTYLHHKLVGINHFFTNNRLDSAVLGLSGGVDSALVFCLLLEASKLEGSPIRKILPLLMPIYGEGATNQGEAEAKAMQLMKDKAFTDYRVVNLTEAYQALVNGSPGNAWAQGQLASVLRTPALYYHAALLQTQGYASIVVGTTNRDEGSYIGFFGKASDGMVDLQPIADIHKSEVYQVAKKLGVSDVIMQAKPSGDVFDGRCDEEMIGAPYWALELYLLLKDYSSPKQVTASRILNYALPDKQLAILNQYSQNIEALHEKNKHKYAVGSPAHFIDVMNRKVFGGWN
jgi:NAD+ synthetase